MALNGRRILVGLLALTMVLAVAARFPRLDGWTVHLPHPIRAAVAEVALREGGVGPRALDRALRLDPDNAEGWSRRCAAYVGSDAAERLSDCGRAVSLRDSAENLRAQARALEENGNPCAASSTYGAALTRAGVASQRAYVLREQGRTALACGDIENSLRALRRAEELDRQEGADGLTADRGYLSAVYGQLNQPERAGELCQEANPGYARCSCEVAGAGVTCTPNAVAAIR